MPYGVTSGWRMSPHELFDSIEGSYTYTSTAVQTHAGMQRRRHTHGRCNLVVIIANKAVQSLQCVSGLNDHQYLPDWRPPSHSPYREKEGHWHIHTLSAEGEKPNVFRYLGYAVWKVASKART